MINFLVYDQDGNSRIYSQEGKRLFTKPLEYMPNMLLVAGDGRNVGKTYFSCKIIKHLSLTTSVIGIKISSHFHKYSKSNPVLVNNNKFIIIEEQEITNKDSSLLLQAGAKKVFFIMAKQKDLAAAFKFIKPELMLNPVVCESAGLREIVFPGAFLFVKSHAPTITKKHLLKYNPTIVTNNFQGFNFDIRSIDFIDNQMVFRESMRVCV